MALTPVTPGRSATPILVTPDAHRRVLVGRIDVGSGAVAQIQRPSGCVGHFEPVARAAEPLRSALMAYETLLHATGRHRLGVCSRIEGVVVRDRQFVEVGRVAEAAVVRSDRVGP